MPRVNAFWSVTLDDAQDFLAANPIGRYAIGDAPGAAGGGIAPDRAAALHGCWKPPLILRASVLRRHAGG
ncbi:MAG: DUF1214 domain-containing protein [Actinomycetota bacterium]|nr:DUF1214 domain-containing protein [Actinomycetota bacterium]